MRQIPTASSYSPCETTARWRGQVPRRKGGSPFYLAFLKSRPDTFVIGYAVGDGCALATIDGDGRLTSGLW